MTHEEAVELIVIMERNMPGVVTFTLVDMPRSKKHNHPAYSYVGICYNDRCAAVVNSLKEYQDFIELCQKVSAVHA